MCRSCIVSPPYDMWLHYLRHAVAVQSSCGIEWFDVKSLSSIEPGWVYLCHVHWPMLRLKLRWGSYSPTWFSQIRYRSWVCNVGLVWSGVTFSWRYRYQSSSWQPESEKMFGLADRLGFNWLKFAYNINHYTYAKCLYEGIYGRLYTGSIAFYSYVTI